MKFDLPIRIHWQPGDPVDKMLMRSLLDSSPLAVTVEIDRPEQLTVLDLPWNRISTIIIYRGWRERGGRLPSGQARRWEFPIGGPGDAKELAETGFLGLPPGQAALRWYPARGKVMDLVPIFETVIRTGCGLTLSNRPGGVITSESLKAFPAAGEFSGKVLSGLKESVRMTRPGQIRVHDHILAEALDLDLLEPAGCEAANSIAFIDRDGIVYPCQSLLIPMGDLRREKLGAIWSSPLKESIRQDISSVPGTCLSCSRLERCHGGCRGAVYHIAGHFGAPDPVCPYFGGDDRHE